MKKKSQAQVFTYIAALIIAALVLLLGYKGISSLAEAGSKASLVRLQQTLKKEINDTALSFGSVRTLQLGLPSGRTGICFIDRTSCGSISHKLIKASCEKAGLNDNAFLLPDGSEKFGVGGIKVVANDDDDVSIGCACFMAKGGLASVRIRGEGDSTKIVKGTTKETTGVDC